MKVQQSNTMSRLAVALLMAMAVIFGGLATASAQDVKIGYVDMQEALNSIEEGKRVKARLEREFAQRQERLDAKQNEVMQMRQELEQQAMMLSEDARRERVTTLQTRMQELQELYLQLQSELAQQEAEATKSIFDRMRGIIATMAREQGYTLILERTESSVLYAADGMNLTTELVRRYNAARN
ncbi:OmpH family outer membrane protein [Lujinxingia litoralis]|nr:OmpH family outer membrane protein [Lujinxingia litoralis]